VKLLGLAASRCVLPTCRCSLRDSALLDSNRAPSIVFRFPSHALKPGAAPLCAALPPPLLLLRVRLNCQPRCDALFACFSMFLAQISITRKRKLFKGKLRLNLGWA
jgi:hypothetical protein